MVEGGARMKSPLLKRIPRDFRKNAGKYLGMFLILVLTIMIGSGFFATVESTKLALTSCETENMLEDGFFETPDKLNDDMLHRLELLDFSAESGSPASVRDMASSSENNSEDAKALILSPNFYYRVNDFDQTAKLLVFDERTVLDIPCIFEGRLPETENEIALDRICATEHGLKTGDSLILSGQSFTICGLVALPDYNSLFASNSDLVMNTFDFGVSVVSHGGFLRFDRDCITYRYSYRFTDRTFDEAAQQRNAETIVSGLIGLGVVPTEFLTASANQSISFLKLDIGKDGPMMELLVYILIAVIAFVFAVLTNNTIDSEAPIIGTLRALGYTKKEITLHYLTPVIIIALTASVVGNILGYTIMLEPIYDMYYTTYSVPRITTVFNISTFIKTTVVPVILMPLINIIMLRRKLSLSPLRFLRRDLKKGKRRYATRLTKGSFLHRFRLRVILQNKSSYIILFFGILLSTLLLLFGIGIGPMFDNYVDSIADSTPYEYQYILKTPYEAETESENGTAAQEKAELYTLNTFYAAADKDISITMLGISENSRMFDFIKLPEKENEGIITSDVANKLGLDAGDSITLTHPYSRDTYIIKIVGVQDYSGQMAVFMNMNLLNKLLGNPDDTFNTYFSNEPLNIPEACIAKYITKKDLCGAAQQMIKSFDYVIKLINIFSVAIYMILMFILTKTVIEKNALSISYLKVFGYSTREINRIFIASTTITVIISLLIAIPADMLLMKYLMVLITVLVEGYISFYVPVWVIALIAVICIAAYFAVNTLHIRHIRRIPMRDALKIIE